MEESSKNRLIIMAHPDDPELSCGGSIALWAKKGSVYNVIVSCGEKGTWNRNASPLLVAEKREKEARKAARYLGVDRSIFLRHPDGEISSIKTLKLELAALIRKLKPYTIVTHDPWSRYFHPDHRATAQAVIEGIMIARDWHFYPFLLEIGLKPHRPKELLLGITEKSNHVIDITTTYKKKIKAISMHKSQLGQLPDWQKRVRNRVRNDGILAGYKFGEGFYKMRV
ncbi:MAG: PIG-L family deacetylase [candidate division WOR-3 bacterium]|nr:PIG-L family deacetylase [candidate division WOR-3 bacterium]